MFKRLELQRPDSCLNKADMDEMIFVLRAKDKLAPHLIRAWADLVESVHGTTAKVMEARDCAEVMERYPERKFPD